MHFWRAVRVLRDVAASPHPVRDIRNGVAERYARWKGHLEKRRAVEQFALEERLSRDGTRLLARPEWIIRAQPGPRADLYVRILAVEEFAGLNTVGARLYDKFMGVAISAHRSARRFGTVFESIASRGLDASMPLVAHRNRVLGDGWNRLSCAIFLGVENVVLDLALPHREPFVYTEDTLRMRGFTPEEVELVRETEFRILAGLNSGGVEAALVRRAAPSGGGAIWHVPSASLLQAHRSDTAGCLCLDVFIRVLAIEQLEGRNGCGIALYRKLWAAHGRTPRDVDRFAALVRSFEEHGFAGDRPIALQMHAERNRPAFADGKHRFACALHFGIDSVPVRWSQKRWPIADNSASGLLRIGFTPAELEVIGDAEVRHRARLGLDVSPPPPHGSLLAK